MSHVKIQINSKEALERLLANDTEFEIEVRASVLHAYRAELEKEYKLAFERKLSHLLDSESCKRIEKLFADELLPQIKSRYRIGNDTVVFDEHSPTKRRLDTAVSNYLDSKIEELKATLNKEYYALLQDLPKRVKGAFDELESRHIRCMQRVLTELLKKCDTTTVQSKATFAAMEVIINEVSKTIDIDNESNTK